MTREQKINKVIELTKKKLELLNELKTAERYEKCKYHIITFKEKGCDTMYMLVDIKTKKELFFGREDRINNYIKTRNITNIYKP